MKPPTSRLLSTALLLLGGLGASSSTLAAEPATGAAKAKQDARMAWFREAKFGLFIHWGLYAVPAGEWKGQLVPGIGEWIMYRAKIPVGEYEQLTRQFNPVKFDAEAWVQMAEDAGMKYIVITSKHHDGFAMYQSKVSRYNIFDATPFKRDPLKELAVACARHGIRFGFYYSQSQDWHEAGGAGNDWDFPADAEKDKNGTYDQYLRTKAEPQVRELLQNYGPVCLIWFDTPKMMGGERGQRFVEIVRALQPATLIDGRLGTAGDYESTGDNVIPMANKQGDWEVPATTNHTWGFKKDDTDWKSPGEIIFKLLDIASKGGNYLLNVGPTAEGVIPQPSQDNLRTVGRWLKVHGEAVYGTARSPFGEEFGDYAATLKDGAGQPLFLVRPNAWRCTTKPGKVYFTIFGEDMPRNGFDLPAFKNAIRRAYLLGDPNRANLEIKSAANGERKVMTPRPAPFPLANVLCVEIAGDRVER
ncbi:MAG: alpha-L-fucosidase [Opitutaceae bacterium]|nr:alpha-L-fucosidase [Opitutaceae bacterium]